MNKSDLKDKLSKSVDFLSSELKQIRTGRATPSLVEGILVDVYGTKMAIRELASITLLDPRNIIVSPWDKNLLTSISKAIREDKGGLNPVEESDKLRVPVPSLTEERRKDFVKIVSQKIEEIKNSMRNIRQDAMKDIEKDFSEKLISEDQKYTQKDEVEKIMKEYIEKVDEVGEAKKNELLTI